MTNLEISPSEALVYNPDYLAVFTYSSNIDPRTMEIGPSSLSKFVADVALAAWANTDSRYTIASETSFEGYATTGRLIRDFYIREGLPEGRVKLIDDMPSNGIPLNNTSEQVQALGQEFVARPVNVLGLALSYHIPRILKHAEYYRLKMDLVAADKLYESAYVQAGIDEFGLDRVMHEEVLDAIPAFAAREKTVRRATFFDHSGWTTRLLNKRLGNCLHDLDPVTRQVVISTIPKRLEELEEIHDLKVVA